MAINEKYSFKDFTNKEFTAIDPAEFNNSEIKGSCFYQEAREIDPTPDKDIFPSGMIGVLFTRNNIDNCNIPPGNTVGERNCNRRIKIQNDWHDWVLDGAHKPIEPVSKKYFLKKGMSIDPTDIPAKATREESIFKCEWDKTFGLGQLPTDTWFREVPTILETKSEIEKHWVEKEPWDTRKQGNNYAPFDEMPTESTITMATKKIYQRDVFGKIVLNDRGRPTVIDRREVEVIKLVGRVTKYKISGWSKLTR